MHKTHIKPWFIQQMKELVELEEEILQYKGQNLPDELLTQAKKDGFADRYLAKLLGLPEARDPRQPHWPWGWSRPGSRCRSAASKMRPIIIPPTMLRIRCRSATAQEVMVLGGGPNRIGQGIEFDYCCVHAAFALRDDGL